MEDSPPAADMPAAEGAPKGLEIWLPLAGVVAGMLILVALGMGEGRWAENQPWGGAVIRSGDAGVPDEALRFRVLPLPREIVPEDGELLDALETHPDFEYLVAAFGPYATERLAVFDAPPESFAPVLASGRLPEPGSAEVLAGVFTRVERFSARGTEFTVVGRIARGAWGLDFVFVLPDGAEWDDLFHDDGDGEAAFYVPDPVEYEGGESASLPGLTHPGFTWAAIACLLLIALCGAVFQLRLFAMLAPWLPRPFRPLNRAMAAYPRLLIGLHVFFLGAFLLAMGAGVQYPLWHARVFGYIAHTFSEGELGYITEAFASQNPFKFAAAIFANNYGLQTLVFTFLLSVPPFAFGVLKTLVSFAVAGFGMAPLWVGAISGYSFHSITMTLEFEPYILACFAVLLWPHYLYRAARTGAAEVARGVPIFQGTPYWPRYLWRSAGRAGAEVLEGVRIFLSAILWSGVLLAIAAFYEAVTLMLYR